MNCFCYKSKPKQTFVNTDLKTKSIEELHEIIIEIKRKHYFEGGTTKFERTRWKEANNIFNQKLDKLPVVYGISSCDIYFE